MRAAHRDWIIERGATARLAFQLYQPSTSTIAAADLIAGDYVMLDSRVETVYSVTPLNGSVELRFGGGNWSDPVVTVKADATFQLAQLQALTAVRAGYEYDYPVVVADDGTVTGGPLVVPISAGIQEDGNVVLTLTDTETWALPDGTGQWDCFVQQDVSGDWLRVLEGQFSAVPTVAGTAFPGLASTGRRS